MNFGKTEYQLTLFPLQLSTCTSDHTARTHQPIRSRR